MVTTTPNLGLNKPLDGGDTDLWGPMVNSNFDVLDLNILTKTDANTLYLTKGAAATSYLPLAGGIMSGFITLHADPTAAMHPATMGWVQSITGSTMTEAPTDNFAYLRSNLSWTSGGTLKAPLQINNTTAYPIKTTAKGHVMVGTTEPATIAAAGTQGGVLMGYHSIVTNYLSNCYWDGTNYRRLNATQPPGFMNSTSGAWQLNVAAVGAADSVIAPITAAVFGPTAASVPGSFTAKSLWMDGASGTNRSLVYTTAAKSRWSLETTIAESTGNAGSDLYLSRFDDAGTFIDSPLSFNRASGNVTFNKRIFVGADIVATTGVFAINNADFGFFQTGTTRIFRWAANWQDLFDNNTGARFWNGGSAQNLMQLSPVGTLTAAAGVFALNDQSMGMLDSGPNQYRWLRFLAEYAFLFTVASGTLDWRNWQGTLLHRIDSGGNLVLPLGNGFKPGGGAWADASDIRIKNVEADYSAGLTEILALRPVVYRFKGNDGDPQTSVARHAGHSPDRSYIGLVAQDAEPFMPEMISLQSGWIDGEAVDDMRTMDTTPLTYALVNSTKELKDQIEGLRQRIKTLEEAA